MQGFEEETQFFGPLDFSNIWGYPHECNAKNDGHSFKAFYGTFPAFHADGGSVVKHVFSFLKFIEEKNEGHYFHEDIMMKLFPFTLEGCAEDWWFWSVDKRDISSFIWLLGIFCERWGYDEQWLPMFESIKGHNYAQKIVDEGSGPPMEDQKPAIEEENSSPLLEEEDAIQQCHGEDHNLEGLLKEDVIHNEDDALENKEALVE